MWMRVRAEMLNMVMTLGCLAHRALYLNNYLIAAPMSECPKCVPAEVQAVISYDNENLTLQHSIWR